MRCVRVCSVKREKRRTFYNDSPYQNEKKNKRSLVLCRTSVLTEYLCSSFSIFNSYFFLLSVLFAGSSRHIISACRANNAVALVSRILFDGRIPAGATPSPLLLPLLSRQEEYYRARYIHTQVYTLSFVIYSINRHFRGP